MIKILIISITTVIWHLRFKEIRENSMVVSNTNVWHCSNNTPVLASKHYPHSYNILRVGCDLNFQCQLYTISVT